MYCTCTFFVCTCTCILYSYMYNTCNHVQCRTYILYTPCNKEMQYECTCIHLLVLVHIERGVLTTCICTFLYIHAYTCTCRSRTLTCTCTCTGFAYIHNSGTSIIRTPWGQQFLSSIHREVSSFWRLKIHFPITLR